MAGHVAQVRANWLKLIVGAAKRQPPAVRDAFFDQLPPGLRAEVRQMSMLAWVDADRFASMARAVAEGLGPEVGARFWCSVMSESLDRPLLRPLRDGAVGIFGRSPASLFRYGGQAWSLVTREVCDFRFERLDHAPDGRAGRQHFDDVTPEISLEDFSLFCRGAAKAVLEVLGAEGDAEILELDATHRQITVETTWSGRPVEASVK